MSEDLVFRLRKRAEIRRSIPTRKSVQEGQPDRIADLLEEAARAIEIRDGALDAIVLRCSIESMASPSFLQEVIRLAGTGKA